MPTVALSSCRDRTSEFHNTIRSFQSRMTNNRPLAPTSKNMRDREAIHLKHQFMLMAKYLPSIKIYFKKFNFLKKNWQRIDQHMH